MFIADDLLRNIEEAKKNSGKFGANLEETPIEKRKIFKVKENENTDNNKKEKREKCYKKMIDMFNNIENNFEIVFELNIKDKYGDEFKKDFKNLKKLGPLLRELWKKYENELMINEYDLNEASYYGEKDGKSGIFINLLRNTKDSNWLAGYHTIFHEFFHNIYDVARLKDINTTKDFGNALIKDVNKLLEEEKDKKSTKKRLNNLTFNARINKKDKAVLYDIIGAVLYKGKYGCYPDNSKLYNKYNEECKIKFSCKCTLSCETCEYETNCNSVIRETKIKRCSYRGVDPFYKCAREECVFKNDREVRYDYRRVCNLCINSWCDEIFGHGYIDWLREDIKNGCIKTYRIDPFKEQKCLECNKKGKFPKCVDHNKFPEILAEEAFVQIAAEAIANQNAYEYIVECLPDSHKILKKILEDILHEELKKSYGLQT